MEVLDPAFKILDNNNACQSIVCLQYFSSYSFRLFT